MWLCLVSQKNSYYFFRDFDCERALPASVLVVRLVERLLNAFEAFEATLDEVVRLLELFDILLFLSMSSCLEMDKNKFATHRTDVRINNNIKFNSKSNRKRTNYVEKNTISIR